MEGSQQNGVDLSITICCWDIRLLTTFWFDLMIVGTPLTRTVMSMMGSETLIFLVAVRFIGRGQSRLFHVEHNTFRQLFLSSQRR